MRRSGFTLIELLITVAILIIVGTMSASFYSRFLVQNATMNAVDQLVGSFRKAQLYSMTGRQNGQWGVHYGSNTITLFQGASYATRTSGLDETFSVNNNVTISGFTEITFARVTGLPSSSPTITITGGNTAKSISINGQGVVSRN